MYIFSSLTKQQKKETVILSVGSLLEYFDLMLYFHLSILLDEIFFPPADHRTASLLRVFAIATPYFFRPFGALLFGYIGDNFGRKASVIVTTSLMSAACIVMAALPPYAQIGITASWIIFICRAVQGMSSMGELVGAQLYVTEMVKRPEQYPAVTIVEVFATLGELFAVTIAALVTSYGFSWRLGFCFGALIAVVGTFARTRLRETPEFANAQHRVKKVFQKNNIDLQELESSYIYNQKVRTKTFAAFVFIDCGFPIWFYITFVHCGDILKNSLQLSAIQVIQHNVVVSIFSLIAALIMFYLSYAIYPLLILKVKLIIFWGFVPIMPYLLNHAHTPFDILLIQLFSVLFVPTPIPAIGIFYSYFPVFKRFTAIALIFSLSRAITICLAPVIIVYLLEYLGNWALLLITVPLLAGYTFGLNHFFQLEKATGNYFPGKIFNAAVVVPIVSAK